MSAILRAFKDFLHLALQIEMELFRQAPRPGADWFPVGLASSFPDLVSQPLLCKGDTTPGCKVFRIPQRDTSQGTEVSIDEIGAVLTDQVLVFRFRGKFHAIDHVCDLAPGHMR